MLKSATKLSYISPDIITLPDEMTCSPIRTSSFPWNIRCKLWNKLYTNKLHMLHLGKSTLAAPSISFHFCIGKSTSIFNYQLHAVSWTLGPSQNRDVFVPGKAGCLNAREHFFFWWRRVVAMRHGREKFKEGKLFPEAYLMNGVCGSASWPSTIYLRFGEGSSVALAIRHIFRHLSKDSGVCRLSGLCSLHLESTLPPWCSTML